MNSQNKICLFLLFFFTINVFCQTKIATLPKTYTAYKTNISINIDGKVNESIWNKVNWSSNFIDIEGEKDPKYQTKIKIIWDEDFFYILADIKEPHIWGNINKKDAVIYLNNNFEIFIDPDGDTHNYYEIEINALNTIYNHYTKNFNTKVIVYGEKGTGKTYLILNSIARAIDMGYSVIFYDSEAAVDRELMKKFGIDTTKVNYQPCNTVQEFRQSVTTITSKMQEVKRAGGETPKVMIILDSAGNLATAKEIDDAKKIYNKLIKINSNDVRSYYGLFNLNINNRIYFKRKLKNLCIEIYKIEYSENEILKIINYFLKKK